MSTLSEEVALGVGSVEAPASVGSAEGVAGTSSDPATAVMSVTTTPSDSIPVGVSFGFDT